MKTNRSYCAERDCDRVQPIERDQFGKWDCAVCGCEIECVECGAHMDDDHEGTHES